MRLFRTSLVSMTALAGLWAAMAGGPSLGAGAPYSGKLASKTTSFPIKHIIFIMQENRSFDSYFGTFPGANGIPSGTCVPLNPATPTLGCVAPYHDFLDVNSGGVHYAAAAQTDIDDGITQAKMDGFVYMQTVGAKAKGQENAPQVLAHDVMGYHTDMEIPNYWSYAKNFVLQDNLFESVRSWSMPMHLYLTSEWSAICSNPASALSCVTTNEPLSKGTAALPWANLFQLFDINNVTWKYYVGEGTEPDCEDGEMTCDPQGQISTVNSAWNPPKFYAYVRAQGSDYLKLHNPTTEHFLEDIRKGKLPQISWIVPSGAYSEHPISGITDGMEYVTSLINAVMQSPYWANTAIFISWDDWGGFYDHVVPPNVDFNATTAPVQGYGLRVPGILISAYAKPGYIDHSMLSFDSYATLAEDLFAGGTRLNPTALGNPDNRPNMRDSIKSVTYFNGATAPVGNLLNEFDFTQTPLPPLVLSTHIPTNIHIYCRNAPTSTSQNCNIPTVTVAWDPVAAGQVPGPFTYHVTRDGADLPQCVSTSASCSDKPGSGTHLYRAYSTDSNNITSPTSAAAEADEP